VSNALKAYISGLVCVSALALIATSLFVPVDTRIAPVGMDLGPTAGVLAGLALWTVVDLLLTALPVQLASGTVVSVATAPVVVAMILGGPTAAGWVALIGATEVRELRGDVPWYGTLANHAMVVLPAIVGGVVISAARIPLASSSGGPLEDLVGAVLGATVFFTLNLLLAGSAVALKTGSRLSAILRSDAELYANLFMLAPLAWLMAQMYLVAWWASLLFTLPLYTTRVAYHRFVEMREMFTQTIGALAEAVDKRDPYTSQHSQNVMEIAVAIGRVRKVSSADLDALEWGGLLHDIGKIGVPDSILLKPDWLTKEERTLMNAHPEKGAEIIEQVKRLAPVVPLIRHHHEWFNGSGYPQRLVGMEIPELARIIGVADAFEAMTSARPYRMTPLTRAEALAELRRFAGIQFDPQMVEAFAKTEWGRDVPDPARPNEPRQIPTIHEVAELLTTASAAEPGATPVENS
jgi:putative nucleotidyltransferase with HDIG domain